MKTMQAFALAALIAVVSLPPAAWAQCQPVKRALVVGINTYSGPRQAPVRIAKPLVSRVPLEGIGGARPFDNLDGAVNDANDFADLLQSEGYDFPKENVIRLVEEKATAQNILDTFQRRLVDESHCAGDIEVFFYSGHGSQIRNRYVKDETAPDRFDQTLVPYDAAEGVADIRNKELDRLYLAAARKGVYLTVIADSCQSGGLSRGARQFSKGKAAEPDRRYVVDAGPRDALGTPVLPTRISPGVAHPVLLLAAAYETEEAREDGGDRPHGAFTAALLKELQSHGAHAPIGEIFEDVKFAVGLTEPAQHPQIYGEMRLGRDLFGGPAGSQTGLVARVKQMRADGSVVLDKGTLAGLYPGSELVSTSASGVRIAVREDGASPGQSVADVMAGGFTENPQGATFRLDKWVTPEQNALTVYYAPDGPSSEALARDRAVVERLASDGVRVVGDPTVALPAGAGEMAQVWWRKGAWRLLASPSGAERELGMSLDAAQLRQAIGGRALYVNFPLPAKDATALSLGEGTANDAVRVQKQPDRPKKDQYVLAGRSKGAGFEYAWVRPGMTEDDQSATNLPVRTDWVAAAGDFAADLRAKALALHRIYGWMTLEAPGGGTAGAFPYRLALRKVGSKVSLISGRDVTTDGEQYKIWLTADAAKMAAMEKAGGIAPRWVYVIAIDRDGSTQVLIPAAASNAGNHLPADENAPAEIQMTSFPYDFSVVAPFGLDTYILLTTSDELDPRLLEAEGVRTRSAGSGNPLGDLLANLGANSRRRGDPPAIPANWSVERLTFRSQPAAKR